MLNVTNMESRTLRLSGCGGDKADKEEEGRKEGRNEGRQGKARQDKASADEARERNV